MLQCIMKYWNNQNLEDLRYNFNIPRILQTEVLILKLSPQMIYVLSEFVMLCLVIGSGWSLLLRWSHW